LNVSAVNCRLKALISVLAIGTAGCAFQHANTDAASSASLVDAEGKLTRQIGDRRADGLFIAIRPRGCAAPCATTFQIVPPSGSEPRFPIVIMAAATEPGALASVVDRYQIQRLPWPRSEESPVLALLAVRNGAIVLQAIDRATGNESEVRRSER
jgi:hypothetical protein